MTFPQTILPLRVELNLNGTWTDITSKVRAADPGGISIKRGTPDESSVLQPATMTLTLNNRDGRFSPRKPDGIYYGLIGRNTPIRCSITGSGALAVTQETGNVIGTCYLQTPDIAALDIVGDIDVRFDADLTSWRDTMNFVTKWTNTGNQRSYAFTTHAGFLTWRWSTLGSDTLLIDSTVPLPQAQGRIAVRVTHKVNNGAGGNTVTFYYSTTGITGTWVQLGDPVVTAGTTSIFSSSSPAHILQAPDAFNGSVIHGRVYAAQILNGIAGTVVANPDFTVQTNGATSFADSTGKTWTVNASSGSIGLIDYEPRFVGEVTNWPVSWDQSGTDIWSPIECADIVRRLGQGQQPLSSTLRAFINGESSIKAYWPMEDGTTATSFASGLASGNPMTWLLGKPTLATDSTSFIASKPLPQFHKTQITGLVQTYSVFSIGTIQTRFLLAVPSGGAANNGSLCRVYCGGTAPVWDLQYGTGGTLTLTARDSDDTTISAVASGIAFNLNGAPCYVSIHLVQNGANIDWALNTCQPGIPPTIGGISGTLASRTIGRATKIVMNNNFLLDDVTVGHVSVASVITTLTTDYIAVLNAYTGETAITRMKRLSAAQGVPFRAMGAPNGVVQLGPQELDTYVNVMQSAAGTDGGILFSPRDLTGLAYRSVAALSAQPADVTLTTLNQLATFQPVEDDQTVRNDVTVAQPSGSSARVVDTTSAMSTQAPPLGVGVYDTSIPVNVSTDAQLVAQAGWRLRVGTINEARYPTIDVNLASYEIVASALTTVFAGVDIGDRIDVSGIPAWLPPDTVTQTVRGYTESLSQYVRYMSFNCTPATPFNTVGVYGPSTAQASRYSSDGSALAAGVNSTATSLSVATPSGPLWITTATVPADFPFDIRVSGERMTVTAISGTTSPQTFTVTRSVNGVVKAQTNNTVVELFTPAYYSL